jgi:hypothetical protein
MPARLLNRASTLIFIRTGQKSFFFLMMITGFAAADLQSQDSAQHQIVAPLSRKRLFASLSLVLPQAARHKNWAEMQVRCRIDFVFQPVLVV